MEQIIARLRKILMEEMDQRPDLSDEEIQEKIRILAGKYSREYGLSLENRKKLGKALFYSVRRLDILQELLEDPEITEIMVNGPDSIFIEKQGKIQSWNHHFSSMDKLEDVIQQIAGRCNRVINERSPIVDARLDNGDRVNAVIKPVALNGPILTIRRFPSKAIDMNQLIQSDSLTEQAAQDLHTLVEARYTIMIGGGTSTGKTTFLNALSTYIPSQERIITIEDNAELQLQGLSNLVRLESKMANMEGAVEVSLQDLIRTALRMRPDRIIVGEVRGAESEAFLTAANTGHPGSMCTAHANSCYDMLSRLETMVLMGMDIPIDAIRRQIASAVEVLIHLGRDMAGKRALMEVTEVTGYERGQIVLNQLYERNQEGDLVKTGSIVRKKKLERMGKHV